MMENNGRSNPAKSLKQLVACPACRLQYDASVLKPGSEFRCGCGTKVEVAVPRPHDSAVVRCASCGGPRREKGPKCSYCGANFTLHEKDLHTICPECTTRISDKARFCHSCGIPITPQGPAGEQCELACPVCPGEKLGRRPLGQERLSALECGRCGGLWLGHEMFVLLKEKATQKEIPWVQDPEGKSRGRIETQTGPMYRRCVVCSDQMTRRNFERSSGVIIDICPEHGVWTDLGELHRLLAWIQRGGLRKNRLKADRRAREREELGRYGSKLDQILDRAAGHDLSPRRRGLNLLKHLLQ